MRLQVSTATFKHKEFVTGCGFAGSDLYTCSDDKTIRKIKSDGEDGGQIGETLASFPTDLHWCPSASKGQSDIFACGCSDGTFLLMTRVGRLDPKQPVKAHEGAVICVRWNNDGTAIATGGEDGVIKIWSRSGLLRSTLAQTDSMVHSLSWSPDSNAVAFSSGKDVIVKPVAPQAKQLNWKAHEGVVLAVDWNSVNNLIVTGGEDRKYKVWDAFGRPMFQSKPLEFAVTTVAWSSSGEHFAVGLYNSIRLCDRTGWTYSREHVETGSVNGIAWTSDGTQLAGAGANGSVVLGQVLGRRVEWQNFEAVLVDTHKVVVRDIASEMEEEELELKDRVIGLSMGYGSLVVTTALQCCIYALANLNTPHIFDLKDTVNFIQLGEKYILMVDNKDMHVYSYDGRPVCQPKFQGMRPEAFNAQTVSMSTESIAVIDHSDAKLVRVFDTATGKEQGKPIQHVLDVTSVAMNRWGSAAHRKCVLLDRNRDLYVVSVGAAASGGREATPYKLGTMCDSAMWNSETDMLVAMMDAKQVVWYYPNVVFVDRDLTAQTKVVRDASDMGKDPQIVSFDGTHVTVRRSDGALLSSAVSPYPIALYGMVIKSMWEQAIQLCRYVKDNTLWACLAVMALNDRELSTAEVAFAAIDEVSKLQYVLAIKEIPTTEGRNAELALWRRRPDDAERILLQAKLVFRAIDMNMRLFNWDRALALAIQHKTHLDTVLGYRQRYLAGMGREENHAEFLKYAQGVAIDWPTIDKKVEQEKEEEAKRPGARPYQE